MAYRVFIDSMKRKWHVWSVQPSDVDPQTRSSRHTAEDARRLLGDRWTHGWLAFETEGEKRRLAPFPQHWEYLGASDLEALCATATPVHRPRRLIE